jgi:protein SCO1/2
MAKPPGEMMNTTKPGWLPGRRALILLGLISVLLAGLWFWLGLEARQHVPGEHIHTATRANGEHLPSSLPAISFELISHQNKTVTHKNFPGRFLLVSFGYTFCPDVCPLTLRNMVEAMDALARERGGGAMAAQIQPLFITVDPARDTVEVLAKYMPAFDDRMLGLTGSARKIEQVTKIFRVYVGRPGAEEAKRKDYLLDHSAFVYLIAPDGRMIDYYPHEMLPDAIVEKLVANLNKPDLRSISP